ncbi:MAG TPA: DUF4097 family beta strand repeat-containing protein [Candidatus Acidoferrum sp.]|nr:DUF4097 family beta strand repeat-containing protein [Candidatus Acidoferrum sp.]
MKIAIGMTAALAAALLPSLVAQTSGSPAEKDFVSGGRVAITLESGDYDIRASSDNRIHVRWNEASAKGARLKLTTNGKSADLRVENTPNNDFHATIEVPALTDLRIRLTAGDLRVTGIKGDKDIEANAGDMNISVGSASDWGEVHASVTAGDLNAPAFGGAKGGLFRSLNWKGPGKYKLHVHLTAGDVNLRN